MVDTATMDALDATRAKDRDRDRDNVQDRPSRRNRLRGKANQPWWFALPALAVFGVFFLLPNLLNFVYPFTDWSAFHSRIGFVGLSNFSTILHDGSMARDIRITLEYAVLVAVFQNGFGLALALLLERDTRFNRFFRAVFFLPVLISALAVGYIFRALLAQDGALNSVLSSLAGHHVDTPGSARPPGRWSW